MTHHVWVVGRGGLLGSALARRSAADRLQPAPAIPWSDPDETLVVLAGMTTRLLESVGTTDSWSVHWAAGVGTIGATPTSLQAETRVLAAFMADLADRRLPGSGAVTYASSASVYAGGAHAPFSETSPVHPTSAYARAKLDQESAVSAALGGRIPHVIGRISTLYGPGQNLAKPQGLVSTMCLQAVRQRTVRVFVPMDTLRDYIFSDDAAEALRRFATSARSSADLSTRVRNVVRGSAATVGEIASRVRAVGRLRVGIHQAPPAPTAAHVHDLRMRTDHLDELDTMPWTPLSAGISAVYSDVLRRVLTDPSGR